MAYTKQTWTDDVSSANAARLTHIEDGIEAAHLLGGSTRGQYLTVGSNELPAAAKSLCDYVCDGVDDQVQINQALQRASRPADGFGGEGYIGVALVGPRFYVANNNTTPILMYPSTHLTGAGQGTLITPQWSSTTSTRGCIELLNSNVAHTRVSNLTIGTHNGSKFNGYGIFYTQNGNADTYEIKTANDPFNFIDSVTVAFSRRSGFFVTGTAGGARETQIFHCVAWACDERGFYIDSSDCQISDCRATNGGNFARFQLAGGNVKMANCKAYFSGLGAGAGGTSADGFQVTSSRIAIANCDAQDNGRWGFVISGQDVTATNLVADSNARLTSAGGGFSISGRGVYEGIHAHNRTQNAITQNNGIVFSGTPKIYITGRVGLDQLISGPGVAVSGALAANSYARIIRDGSGADLQTLYSVG